MDKHLLSTPDRKITNACIGIYSDARQVYQVCHETLSIVQIAYQINSGLTYPHLAVVSKHEPQRGWFQLGPVDGDILAY